MIPIHFLSVIGLLLLFSATVVIVVEVVGDFFVDFARMVGAGIRGQVGGRDDGD